MQAVTLNKTGQYAIFQLSEPYKYVENVRTFSDDLSGVGTLIKQFRWSLDGEVWSYWIELTQPNLNELEVNPDNLLYVEFKYQLASQGHMTILDIKLENNYKIQDPNAQIVLPSLSCGECGMDRASILTTCTPSFNPYAVNPAINLYKDLSSSISDMFGMDVFYLRAIPKERSGDVVFKEWTLYNVDEPVCTKVMVDNNEFPSDNLQYDAFGISYEQPFEIEIVKENYERDFGLDAAPQKGDILYFPIIGNRLYEIQSSTYVRGFMMEITSWKCELTIYKPKANRDIPNTIQETMEEIMRSNDTEFIEQLESETEELTKPQQYDRTLGTNLHDPIRAYINQDMNIVSAVISNHNTTIAEHYYDLSSILEPSGENIAVKYRTISNFKANQNFAFTTWFKHTKSKFIIPETACGLSGRQGTTVIANLTKPRKYKIGTLVNVYRQGRLNLYGIIVQVINPNTYKIALNEDVAKYLDNLSPSWASAPGYTIKQMFKHTYISGFGEVGSPKQPKGWKFESFADRYFQFTENDQTTLIPLSENLVENIWYGMVFNYAAQFKQINFSLWQIDSRRTAKTDLVPVFTRTINNINPTDKSYDNEFYLVGSNHHQTNIRVFKEIIPQDMQSLILNQIIIDEAQQGIIIDNALPLLRLPAMGKTK